MIRKIKLTDITPAEIERELSFVRGSSLLAAEIVETDYDVELSCEVNEQNRLVYGEVLRALAEFVYTDTDQTPFERLADICDVRGIRVGFVEQGSAGLISAKMLAFDGFENSLCVSFVFGKIEQMKSYFENSNEKEIAKCVEKSANLDAVVVTTADFESNPLVPTVCKVVVLANGLVETKVYQILGNKEQVSNKLAFLATCLLDKIIF